nr:rhamnogalacturonan acetylesterase [Bacteroidales bacterium]
RRSFDKKGIIQLTHGDYPDAMRKVAIDREVPLIDVHKMSKELYEAWGINESKQAFVHYPAHTFPGQDKELKDNTHFNEFGANEIASCVIPGIIDLKLPIQEFIRDKDFSYSPSSPHDFADWDVPMSPRYVSEKPAGN